MISQSTVGSTEAGVRTLVGFTTSTSTEGTLGFHTLLFAYYSGYPGVDIFLKFRPVLK